MTTEYAPGTVVTATVNGRPNVRLVSGWSRYDPQLRWCELSPRWGDGDDEECWYFPSQVSDARPLVVIDPEDREQVERLRRTVGGMRGALAINRTEEMQAALREFANPTLPKPEEPTGLGAVVEDANGARWVRHRPERHGTPWVCSRGLDRLDQYEDINAVRILSPGVDA